MSFREGEGYTIFIIRAILVFFMINSVIALPDAPSSDNVIVEVKLEKELHLIAKNLTLVPENDTDSQLFECVIPGLSKDVLSQFSMEEPSFNNVVVSSKSGQSLTAFDHSKESSEEGPQPPPFNVTFNVVNNTLVLKGEVLIKKNSKSDGNKNGVAAGSKDVLTTCEVLLVDTGKYTKTTGQKEGRESHRNIPGKISRALEIEIPLVETVDPYSTTSDLDDTFTATSREALYRYDGDVYDPYHHHSPTPTYPHSSVSCGDHYDSYRNNDLQQMVNLITERLLLGEKVAVYKWDGQLPVEDVYREDAVIQNAIRQARNRWLDTQWTYRFFKDQIEANKDVQYDLLRKWQYEGRRPPGPPVNLARDVRPEIDYINDKLIELASRTQMERRRCKCRTEIENITRYCVYRYNLESIHRKALDTAATNLCVGRPRDFYAPQYPYHGHPPPPMNPTQRPYDRIWYTRPI